MSYGDFVILRENSRATASESAAGLLAHVIDQNAHRRRTVAVTGVDDAWLAGVAGYLINAGHRLLVIPSSLVCTVWREVREWCDFLISCDGYIPRIVAGSNSAAYIGQPDWMVALFTSGSTGEPKCIGFDAKQLTTTLRWYVSNYSLTERSVISTALPATYNFTFIAGVCLASILGCRLCIIRQPDKLIHTLNENADDADRIVVLANPVSLEALWDVRTSFSQKMLIDSGGAPLSITAVKAFRTAIADLREGYGLTETCSLTHFDVDGGMDSVGTAGRAMPGVSAKTSIESGKPLLNIRSPNIGSRINLKTGRSQICEEQQTGDLAAFVGDYLRILGRSDDVCIRSFWPKDTLDLVGPILGHRSALVRQPNLDRVTIRLSSVLQKNMKEMIEEAVADELQLPPQSILIESTRPAQFLHSWKIPRT